jgi:hypothetical protein
MTLQRGLRSTGGRWPPRGHERGRGRHGGRSRGSGNRAQHRQEGPESASRGEDTPCGKPEGLRLLPAELLIA